MGGIVESALSSWAERVVSSGHYARNARPFTSGSPVSDNKGVEQRRIHHRPRHFDHTLCRRLEYEREIVLSPADMPDITVRCPDCDCIMMYRGVGRLRNGTRVHSFECVHSYREVHSLSIVCSE